MDFQASYEPWLRTTDSNRKIVRTDSAFLWDIRIEFGQDKWSRCVVKRRKIVDSSCNIDTNSLSIFPVTSDDF